MPEQRHFTTRRGFIAALGFGAVSLYGAWAAYGAAPLPFGAQNCRPGCGHSTRSRRRSRAPCRGRAASPGSPCACGRPRAPRRPSWPPWHCPRAPWPDRLPTPSGRLRRPFAAGRCNGAMSSDSGRLCTIATLAPSSRNCWLIPNPMPRPPPVTTANLPASLPVMNCNRSTPPPRTPIARSRLRKAGTSQAQAKPRYDVLLPTFGRSRLP
jgi:hypothetical protein